MITVIYDPINGDTVADGKAEDFVKTVIANHPTSFVQTSNSLVVQLFRCMIAEKVIDPSSVKFLFRSPDGSSQILKHNKYAKFEDWPKGFIDYEMAIVGRIIDAGLKRNKKVDSSE